jgi:glycosyltransferase involved in cell wall biosynthesis
MPKPTLRVLLAHELFPPDFAGGGEVVALQTARELRRRGADVRVVTSGDPSITEYEGFPTFRVTRHRYRLNLAWRTMTAHAREVDIVHCSLYHAALPGLVAARRAGRPVVCMIKGLFADAWKEMRGPATAWAFIAMERFLVCRRYDRTLFPSAHTREHGLALGVPPERSVVITPGIELERYAPAARKEDHVLFVGKLDPRKGLDDLLAIARELPDVAFRVVGWGPREAEYRAAAPPNVEVARLERGAALERDFARARIFVCASRVETFGLAVVEAMASGCAVVSTVDVGQDGPLIPVGDRAALREAIVRLWSDRDACASMGARNVVLAQEHSWARFGDRLMEIYENLLGAAR